MGNKTDSILAAFGQLNRDREFQIVTKILGKSSGISVCKESYTADAIPHIHRLISNHERLSTALSPLKKVRLVNIIGTGDDFVEFEYIKGRNVDQEAFQCVMSGDYSEVIKIIDRVFALIDGLSSQRSVDESSAVQKINNIYTLPSSSKNYVNPGIIDLNLDNFILSPKDELVIFDYEWIFDQPIAADFIKTRVVYTFFARRSEAFAFLPSKSRVFKTLWEGDARTLIPSEIYAKYAKLLSKESMRKYWEAEDVFQKSVTGHRVDTAKLNYKNFVSEELASPQPTFPEIEELRRSNYESQLAQTKSDYQSLLERAANAENELALIKGSTTYRIARKMAAAKGKIIKK